MSYEFGFYVESLAGDAGAQAEQTRWLPLPGSGGHMLLVATHEWPRLLGGDVPEANAPGVVFQRIQHDYQTYLTMLAPHGPRLRVNGIPAGPVSVLRVKDQVQIDTSYVLHVSAFLKPHIGAPEPGEVGQGCLICRTPVLADQTIYRCPNCELTLHCGRADGPAQNRLECALAAAACPRCTFQLVRKEGFAYVPEL